MNASTAHNAEAERALLGAVFIGSDDQRAAIFGTVRREWFFKESHRMVWDAMIAVERAGQPIDAVSVLTTLRDLGTLESAGSGPGVSLLATLSPTATNWAFYAGSVESEARRRALSAATSEAQAGFGGDDPIQAAGELVTKVNQVLAGAEAQTVYTGIDASRAMLAMLTEAQKRAESGRVVQWSMSSPDLSDAFPLMPGHMNVLGMRSGGGKTTMAANGVMFTAAAGESVGFHSVEMPVAEANIRLCSRVADINELACLKGRPSQRDGSEIEAFLGRNGGGRLPYMVTKPSRSIDDVERKVRHLYAVHGIRYHLIDYFQLLRSPQRFSSRSDELNDIGQRLKQLTVDLPGCALGVLAQMNKVWEGSTPRKENIRYGSGLCDSADGVTLGWRPNRKFEDDDNSRKFGHAKGEPPAPVVDNVIKFNRDKGRFGGEHVATFGWENGRVIDKGGDYDREMRRRSNVIATAVQNQREGKA